MLSRYHVWPCVVANWYWFCYFVFTSHTLDGQAEKAKLQKQASTDKPDGLNRSDSNSSNSSQSNGNKAAPIKNSSASYIQTHGGDRSVREKCRQMLASSLKCEQRPG